MARRPPSVCFPPSPATASYASETSHFVSSSPTLHHTPLQNTHKHVDLFAWDVLLHSKLNYTAQLCKFKLSKQGWHSAFQRQFYLTSPQEISSGYQSERVPYTVMPGNPTFTVTQTSNSTRTLRRRYISSHNEGFCRSRVFPIGCGRWWSHRETDSGLIQWGQWLKVQSPQTGWSATHNTHSRKLSAQTALLVRCGISGFCAIGFFCQCQRMSSVSDCLPPS